MTNKNKQAIKKYKIVTIFNSSICDFKLSKQKEIELKNIVKEIKRLGIKLDSLFK